MPEGFTVNPKLAAAARPAPEALERRRDRLGSRRGARALEPAGRRHPHPADRPGHGARHVRATGTSSCTTPRRARRTRRSSTSTRPPPRSRSTTRRCRSSRRWASSTGTRWRPNESLVLWEAQFGDFVNGAQVIVDQFLVSGLSKWQQTSRLTLLLPHGYEGNGPEHSSARLERFLQLAAQENVRIVNATTAAQYFHLLRRQALDPSARPLIVMTPKGLLRMKEATSTLRELTEGTFQPVLDEPGVDRERVRRLVLTSGKVYYDIVGHSERAERTRRSPSRGSSSSIRSPSARPPTSCNRYPDARRGRVGPGGAAEHGRVPGDQAPARGGRRRPRPAAATPAGRGVRARVRATRRRTCASRTGSSETFSAARAWACGARAARRRVPPRARACASR